MSEVSTNNHNVIALICCRGGSKGIPGKNINSFAGKPLLGWTLEAATASGVFDDILLSTDSEEIAAVGREYGATVNGLRPSHLAEDDTDQFDTHAYVFEKESITDQTHRVCILCNNPFIDANLIKQSYATAKDDNFNHVVLDCVKVGGDYLDYRQCINDDGLLKFKYESAMRESGINRQSNVPLYTSINNIRWGKPSVFTSYDAYKTEVISNGFLPVWLPKLRNIDIDEPEDWEIAEAIMAYLLRQA